MAEPSEQEPPSEAERERAIVAVVEIQRTFRALKGIGGAARGLGLWLAGFAALATVAIQGADMLDRFRFVPQPQPPAAVVPTRSAEP